MNGLTVLLRPVEFRDAPFIVKLRNDGELNKFLHSSAQTIEEQKDWLATYFERAGDFYFVIENKQTFRSEGLISLYDLSTLENTAEWGRWILIPSSFAAVESAWLIYQFAFSTLGLGSVYCRTLSKNNKVISFHNSFGASIRREIPNYTQIADGYGNAIEHFLTQKRFHQISPKIERLIKSLAKTRGNTNAIY